MKSERELLRKEISSYCSFIGKNPLWVQGAGGNVSWKENGVLWVKASGSWLSEAEKRDLFVPVDYKHLLSEISRKNFDVKPIVLKGSTLRPSIETLLHALMPQRVVFHLHTINALSHLVRSNGLEQIQKKINKEFKALYLPYFKPGKDLAIALDVAMSQMKDKGRSTGVDLIFLQNHGFILGCEDVSRISYKLERLDSLLECSVIQLVQIDSSLFSSSSILSEIGSEYVFVKDKVIQQLAFNSWIFSKLTKYWALYPDHVVFLGSRPYSFESLDEMSLESSSWIEKPKFIFIKKKGVFSLGRLESTQYEELRSYADIMVRQEESSELSVLNQNQVSDLIDWEAEKYRKKVK